MLKNRFVGRAAVILIMSMSAAWLLPTTAYALIEMSYGNNPVRPMGWPRGAEAVANLPSRLGFMGGPPFGGGEYHFLYHCQDTDEFNRALRQFGAIRSPRTARRSLVSLDGQYTWMTEEKSLLMVVHDWTREPWPESRGKSGGQPPKRVDWTFTVWTPENFYRLFGAAEGNHFSSHPNFRQPVPAPRIDLYVGKDNPIIWEDVEIPATVRVVDRRATKATVEGAIGGVVRGGVFDMATHQVIASAEVVLSQRTGSRQWQEIARVTTNEAGSFEIQDLPAGYYSLEVHAEGYAARRVAPYHNRSGHEDLDLDVLLARAISCQGTVIDGDGNPIAGVTVLARDMVGLDGFGYECPVGPQAKTDEAGRFELLALPGGTTHLRCRAPSLHQETPISETYEVSDKPWRKPQPITIVMSGTGTVTGKVVGPDGQPPTRKFIAEIEPKGGNKVGSWGGSMQCQEDGTFSFKGVPPGEYLVTAKPNPMRSGEASEPQLVIVRTGGTLELEFVNDYAHARKGR